MKTVSGLLIALVIAGAAFWTLGSAGGSEAAAAEAVDMAAPALPAEAPVAVAMPTPNSIGEKPPRRILYDSPATTGTSRRASKMAHSLPAAL